MDFINSLPISLPDIAVIAVALIVGLRGLIRGLSGELSHLISSGILVVLFMFVFNPISYELADKYDMNLWLARSCVAGTILLVNLGLFFVVNFLLASILKNGVSTIGNKLMGFVCGIFHGLFIMLFLMIFAYTVPNESFFQRVYVQSYSGRFVDQYVMPIANPYINPEYNPATEVPAEQPEQNHNYL